MWWLPKYLYLSRFRYSPGKKQYEYHSPGIRPPMVLSVTEYHNAVHHVMVLLPFFLTVLIVSSLAVGCFFIYTARKQEQNEPYVTYPYHRQPQPHHPRRNVVIIPRSSRPSGYIPRSKKAPQSPSPQKMTEGGSDDQEEVVVYDEDQ